MQIVTLQRSSEKARKEPRDDGAKISFLASQQNWRRRIKKEEGVNAKLQAQFSVRSVLRSLNVPKLYKPCQVDPEDARQPAKLDQETTEILRADIAAKSATPHEHLLWPETTQHNVGWLHDRTGDLPFSERRTFVAPKPKVGFGWPAGPHPVLRRQKNGQTCNDAAGFDALVPDSTRVGGSSPSCRAAKNDAAKASEAAPSVGELRRARRLMRNSQRRGETKANSGSLTDRRAARTPEPRARPGGGETPATARTCSILMEPASSSGLWNAVKQPVEDPWLNRKNDAADELIRPNSSLTSPC
eukprot:TRINITY_DN16274_c0_g3_i1.p1 TRINITY_DN16274_c0_g3~~TRINITY_DN16274_c0_g3_i1.p1  ORF type:complete len:301 (+),score=52.52 TRINITY_DN16274_c0_g3_i1:59-961(+)